MSFTGFYRETFEFLFEIAFNNEVEWFNENRKRYERFVRDPLRGAALMKRILFRIAVCLL